jgi:hypothetical protein
MKSRPCRLFLTLLAGLFAFAAFFLSSTRSSCAQEGGVLDSPFEITARAHLFPDVGPGIKAMKRDSQGRYYFLSTTDHVVRIYTADNTFLGQIPRTDSAKTAIVDGEDLDIGPTGRVYVADRGANAVKVYAPNGSLSLSIPVESPISVAALASGQIAISSLKSRQLVVIYDAMGKYLREFGDISDLADHEELNRYLNLGRLATDPTNHVYYAFLYSPEPTVRKYDLFGVSPYEISLHTLDVYPSAQAQRREISRADAEDTPQPVPVVINAIGVDPQTEEVWLSLGDFLMKFDKSGNRLKTYRTLTSSGEDLTPSAILIEPHRILLADDPQGVFEFARPDLPYVPAAKTK